MNTLNLSISNWLKIVKIVKSSILIENRKKKTLMKIDFDEKSKGSILMKDWKRRYEPITVKNQWKVIGIQILLKIQTIYGRIY